MKPVFYILLSFCAFTAKGQGWQWGISNNGDTGINGIQTTACDYRGNVFIAGINLQNALLGSWPLPDTNAFRQAFIAKVDGNGNYLWAGYSENASATPLKIITDNNGNCYLFGIYTTNAGFTFADATGVTATVENADPSLYSNMYFLAKFDPAGSIQWLKNVAPVNGSTTVYSQWGDMGIDSSDKLFITGIYYLHTISVGGISLTSNADSVYVAPNWQYSPNLFVARYDTNGNAIWAETFSDNDPGGSGQSGLAVTKSGNMYLCGYYIADSIKIGSTILKATNVYYGGAFVAKLDASGNVLWAENLFPNCYVSGSVTDDDENLYLTGVYQGDSAVAMGGDTVNNSGYSNFFIAKYDAAGKALWAHDAAVRVPYGEIIGGRIAIDDCNKLWVSGMIAEPLDSTSIRFGDYHLPIPYSTENVPYSLQYDAAGNCLTGFNIFTEATQPYLPIFSIDHFGNLYVSGTVQGPVFVLGPSVLYSASMAKFFLGKYQYAAFTSFPDTLTNAGICAGSYTELHAPPGYFFYEWNDGTAGPDKNITEPGTYYVVSDNVCTGKQLPDTITVTGRDCSACITMPNAFTPNNDGLNDLFGAVIKPWCNISIYTLRIYDRWGVEIFNTSDAVTGWDGKYKGVPQNTGTYEYLLEYGDPAGSGRHLLKGDVTLIR